MSCKLTCLNLGSVLETSISRLEEKCYVVACVARGCYERAASATGRGVQPGRACGLRLAASRRLKTPTVGITRCCRATMISGHMIFITLTFIY